MSTIVSLSGGQDSATCLFYALMKYGADLQAVSFDYGQRHRVELDCARRLARLAGAEHTILDLGSAFTQMGAASLTNPGIASRLDARGTGNAYAAARGLPSSFVPGRNAVLLSYAAAFGAIRGCDVLVTGVCEEDDAGYPDCRGEFIDSLQGTLGLALDGRVIIDTPLMHRSKADTWELADELGVRQVIVDHTHTCYEGDHVTRHRWGYGCGECPACKTRAAGFEEYLTRSAARA